MIVLLWVAFCVGVAALLVAAIARIVDARNAPGNPGQTAALISVPAEVQDAARWHLDQHQRPQAVRLVRRSAGLGMSEAVAVANALAADEHVPTSHAESAQVLAAHYPELAAQLRQLTGQGQMIAAMRMLRRHVPVTVMRAKHLVDTLAL